MCKCPLPMDTTVNFDILNIFLLVFGPLPSQLNICQLLLMVLIDYFPTLVNKGQKVPTSGFVTEDWSSRGQIPLKFIAKDSAEIAIPPGDYSLSYQNGVKTAVGLQEFATTLSATMIIKKTISQVPLSGRHTSPSSLQSPSSGRPRRSDQRGPGIILKTE